jgi:hypothetical protein
MAKKKEKKEEARKKMVFDLENSIKQLEIPDMLKTGFKFYIVNNNITIKSENELERELTKFKNTNAGE